MKNKRIFLSFVWYCLTHREERLWQSLRNWSGYKFIYIDTEGTAQEIDDLEDTFYKEDK